MEHIELRLNVWLRGAAQRFTRSVLRPKGAVLTEVLDLIDFDRARRYETGRAM